MSIFDTHAVSGESKFPEAVQFKFEAPGQAVEGKILDISEPINGDFGVYRLVVVEEDGGAQKKLLLGSVGLDKFNRSGAQVGGRLGVRFEGKRPTKDGKRSYNDWTVAYVPAEGETPNGGVPSGRPSGGNVPF